MIGFSLRFAAYLVVIALVFHLEAVAMGRWGWERVLRDDGVIEWTQVAVVSLAALLAMGLVPRVPHARSFHLMMAAALWIVVFREFDDSALYRALPAWVKYGIPVVLLGGIAALDPSRLLASVRALLDRPQGILFVLGVAVTFGWAQLLGQPALWAELYRDVGRGRRVVEESLELAGHLLILFGIVEEHLRLRRRAGVLAVVLGVVLAACGDVPTSTAPPGARPAPAADAPRTEVQDQTPHHGGVVAMAGFLHVEAAAERDGTIRLWLTDAARDPVPLAAAAGHVAREHAGERVVSPLEVGDGVLIARGPPIAGDDVTVDVELRRDGEPIALRFVLPLTAAGARAGAVPVAGCVPVPPSPEGGRVPRCAITFPHGVLAIATGSDGATAVVSEAEGGVSVWRLPEGRIARGFDPPPAVTVEVVEGAEPEVGASAIALRDDGSEAVLAFGARLVRYRVDTGRVVAELPVMEGPVRALAWVPGGERLLAAVQGVAGARLVDAAGGRAARVVPVPQEASAVAVRSDGALAAVGSEIGPIVAFDPRGDAPARAIADVLQPVEALDVDGDRVVWAGADRTLRVWDAASGAALAGVELPAAAVRLAVAPGGGVVAVALRGGAIELRRLGDGARIEGLRFHGSEVRALAWAGPLLLTGDTYGGLAVWDLTGVPGVS